jgi:DNA-binding CsgD family transcriptional regulator
MKRVYYSLAGAKLTPEEAKIVSVMVQGYRGKQVSNILGKSYSTFIHQLQHTYDVTGIHDADTLVPLAEQEGFDKMGNYKGIYLFDGTVLYKLPKGADPSVTA